MGLDAAPEKLCIQALAAEWLIRIRLFHVLAKTNQTMHIIMQCCSEIMVDTGSVNYFFVLGISKYKNNSPAFINRKSFSERTSYLLIESFLPYKKIAISSGVVEFSTVLAL